MVFTNPPDKLLCMADIVVLFDPSRADYRQLLVDESRERGLASKHCLVLEIPIDSKRVSDIEEWIERVIRVRQSA